MERLNEGLRDYFALKMVAHPLGGDFKFCSLQDRYVSRERISWLFSTAFQVGRDDGDAAHVA